MLYSPAMEPKPEFLTPAEIARIVRVGYPTALRWLHGGLLPYVRFRPRSRILVRRIDFDKYVRERLTLCGDSEEIVQ